jgi:hypothetical protein
VRRYISPLAFVASAGLHVGVALCSGMPKPPLRIEAFVVEFEVVTEQATNAGGTSDNFARRIAPREAATSRALEARAQAVGSARTGSRAARRHPTDGSRVQAAVESSTPTQAAETHTPAGEASARRTPIDDLSPLAAARTVLESSVTSEQICDPERPDCRSRGDLSSTLDRQLQASAARVPHLEPRAAPDLTRRSDGSYVYVGPVFKATILPNGHVTFHDHARILQFDLTDIVEKHILGKELYSAEKTWFLEQTAPLRLQVERAYRQEAARSDRSALQRKLFRLTRAAKPPEQIKREIFELWNECADDEVGWHAQELVTAFVRAHMAPGTALAYSSRELQLLNRRKSHRHEFQPYAGEPALRH